MPLDGWIDIEAIDRAEYDAHWAERAVAEYIQGKRREQQRRILNSWLAPYGWRVSTIPTARQWQ